jgi:hypothetical protein
MNRHQQSSFVDRIQVLWVGQQQHAAPRPPKWLDIQLLCELQRIVDLDAEVANSAL